MALPEPLAIYARFFRIGLNAFGGPFTQIATLQQELVVKEKWTTNARFNRVLAVYQVLPGPEATEMSVWLGTCRAGRLGGFAAGLGFLTPGTLLVLLAAFLYNRYGGISPAVTAAMAGAQAAALALLFNAARNLATRCCTDSTLWFIAIAAALSSLANVHFALIIIVLSTLASYMIDRGKNWLGFGLIGSMAFFTFMIFIWQSLISAEDVPTLISGTGDHAGKASIGAAAITGLKAGLLSFGGAYTAVPFLRDDAILVGNWLTHRQFLDGLAIVNTLPTPLVSLAGFVGLLAGGWPAALVMLAAIYLPAFAFTLFGHSRIERLVDNEPLHAALDGAAAAVVGLVAATAVTLFKPVIINLPAEPGLAAAVSPQWPIKAAIFALALGAAIYFKPRWLNPAIILASAAAGAVLLRN